MELAPHVSIPSTFKASPMWVKQHNRISLQCGPNDRTATCIAHLSCSSVSVASVSCLPRKSIYTYILIDMVAANNTLNRKCCMAIARYSKTHIFHAACSTRDLWRRGWGRYCGTQFAVPKFCLPQTTVRLIVQEGLWWYILYSTCNCACTCVHFTCACISSQCSPQKSGLLCLGFWFFGHTCT